MRDDNELSVCLIHQQFQEWLSFHQDGGSSTAETIELNYIAEGQLAIVSLIYFKGH